MPTLFHSIRINNVPSHWQREGFQPIASVVANTPSNALKIVTAMDADSSRERSRTHFIALTSDSELLHIMRASTRQGAQWVGQWAEIQDVAGRHGRIVDVACAAFSSMLFVLTITEDGRAWHAIRKDVGWEPFVQLPGEFTDVKKVTCAAGYNPQTESSELHVCIQR